MDLNSILPFLMMSGMLGQSNSPPKSDNAGGFDLNKMLAIMNMMNKEKPHFPSRNAPPDLKGLNGMLSAEMIAVLNQLVSSSAR